MDDQMMDELNKEMAKREALAARKAEALAEHNEAGEYARNAVAACLDMLDDGPYSRAAEVYHMLAQVLRRPEVLL